jgi:hypothetical protein
MVGMAGFEPATDGSTVHSSAKLSYIPCGALATFVAIKGLLSVSTLLGIQIPREQVGL